MTTQINNHIAYEKSPHMEKKSSQEELHIFPPRNLSFTFRAPTPPTGLFRFYTVVTYWTCFKCKKQ